MHLSIYKTLENDELSLLQFTQLKRIFISPPCLSNGPKPECIHIDILYSYSIYIQIQFTIIQRREKQQIITLEKLEASNVKH